jgi:hypothetical protein
MHEQRPPFQPQSETPTIYQDRLGTNLSKAQQKGVFHSHTGSRGLALQSHSTLYLAEGAVLLGGLRVYDVENVTIRGFGIIATTFLPGQYTALLLFRVFV